MTISTHDLTIIDNPLGEDAAEVYVGILDPLASHFSKLLAQTLSPKKLCINKTSEYRDNSVFAVELGNGLHEINCDTLKKEFKLELDSSIFVHVQRHKVDSGLRFFGKNTKDILSLLKILGSLEPDSAAKEHCLARVSAWDSGWHQRQSVYVQSHKLSKTQIEITKMVDWFYNSKNWYINRKLPYILRIVLIGPSASGKHHVLQHIAQTFNKTLCYLHVAEHTYSAIGAALSSAPLNSIIVLDNLVSFFERTSSSDRTRLLGFLDSHLNTSVCDKNGLLIVLTAPPNTPTELLKFLMIPHRFQRKFNCSIAPSTECVEESSVKVSTPRSSDKALKLGVPLHILSWFSATEDMPGLEPRKNPESADAALEDILSYVASERVKFNQPTSSNLDRFYT